MIAAEIIKTLDGRNGMARCPAHNDRTPSLSVTETEDGVVLLKCFAGCSQDEVMGALTDLGLWNGPANMTPRRRQINRRPVKHTDSAERTRKALEIWRATQPIDGTVGEQYFRNRGITGPIPVSLRYASALHYQKANVMLSGIVAEVSAPDRKTTAIHRTYLTADGAKKAPVTSPKMMLGDLGNGCVRLASAGTSLGIAEGIEDALSAQEIFEIPCWAALSAGRFSSVWIPPEVIEVQIFGDNDAAGHEAADKAAYRFTREGKRVALRFPPPAYKDWNEVAQAMAAA